MSTLTTLTKKECLTDLTGLTGLVGKGGKGVRVACATPWAAMVAHLRGRPAPPLPEIPGRRHVIVTEADAFTHDDREALLMCDATLTEIGRVLGVSRQRAFQLRQALRQRLANTERNDP